MSKIISQRKIEANRRNAKKSTGPKTADGKAKSAMNSIKYGIYSDKYLIKDESYEEFHNYRKKILKCLNPTNAVLFDMATHVVSNGWEYQRCTLLESKILNSKSLKHDAERKQNNEEAKQIIVSWQDPPELEAKYGALEEYSKNEPTDLAEKDNYWKNFDHKKIQSEIKVKKEESIRIENNSDINEVNENNEEEFIEGLPNDLWGINSLYKINVIGKRHLANYHKAFHSYFEAKNKFNNSIDM
jgi:hypothetical protein